MADEQQTPPTAEEMIITTFNKIMRAYDGVELHEDAKAAAKEAGFDVSNMALGGKRGRDATADDLEACVGYYNQLSMMLGQFGKVWENGVAARGLMIISDPGDFTEEEQKQMTRTTQAAIQTVDKAMDLLRGIPQLSSMAMPKSVTSDLLTLGALVKICEDNDESKE